MTPETEKVLARVKKLLNLANNAAATEGERDNAMRMAHATLAKHNLSISEVNAIGDNVSNDPRIKEAFETGADTHWGRQAVNGIARGFFCFYYTEKGIRGHRHVLIGKSVNVATATYMAEYVMASIEREAEKGVKLHYGDAKLNSILDFDDGPKRPEASKPVWKEAFCLAAAQAVAKRMDQIVRDSANQTTDGSTATGTSLVLATVYERERLANLALLKSMGISLTMGSGPRDRHVDSAKSAGTSYGNSLNLSRQVGNSSATKLLK